jgi:hypothetical protein
MQLSRRSSEPLRVTDALAVAASVHGYSKDEASKRVRGDLAALIERASASTFKTHVPGLKRSLFSCQCRFFWTRNFGARRGDRDTHH